MEMRRIIFAAVALIPLFGGVALAQRPDRSSNYNFAAGPEAYPNWQQQWARLPGYPYAQTHAPTQQQQHLATGQMPALMQTNG